ncbi:MAG: GNAT family N-acetyltransferase [Butyrivibrio sp.]|nr:GNAT family N-acetyltransferase [Butyrivibrio sp.]
MTIRDAVEEDIPELLRLLSQVLEVHAAIKPDYFVSGHQKYNTDELKAILKDESVRVYVAAEGKEILGYTFCMINELPKKPFIAHFKYMYIDDLCVDERYRGKDIAKALFEHVKKEAKVLGCREITLNVWEGNDRARAFYDKMGMTPQKTYMELKI